MSDKRFLRLEAWERSGESTAETARHEFLWRDQCSALLRLVILLSLCITINAQAYMGPRMVPESDVFNGISVGNIVNPSWQDLDNDGDRDLVGISGSNSLYFWRNNGSCQLTPFIIPLGITWNAYLINFVRLNQTPSWTYF